MNIGEDSFVRTHRKSRPPMAIATPRAAAFISLSELVRFLPKCSPENGRIGRGIHHGIGNLGGF